VTGPHDVIAFVEGSDVNAFGITIISNPGTPYRIFTIGLADARCDASAGRGNSGNRSGEIPAQEGERGYPNEQSIWRLLLLRGRGVGTRGGS